MGTDILMLTTERGLLMLMLSPRLMLIPTSCTEDTMDLDTMVLDMDTTDIPMLTMARDLLMPNPRLMLTPTSSMVDITDLDIMDSDMHITDTLMLTMARGLLMLSLRLMLILIFFMVDTMDLDTMVLAMAIPMLATPTTDKLSTKEKEDPASKEKHSHPNLLLM